MAPVGEAVEARVLAATEGRRMSSPQTGPRRVRVERNIYKRPTGVLEVGFRDAAGVQRWRRVDGGILAARKLRDELLARRGRGETVAPIQGFALDRPQTSGLTVRCAISGNRRKPATETRWNGTSARGMEAVGWTTSRPMISPHWCGIYALGARAGQRLLSCSG